MLFVEKLKVLRTMVSAGLDEETVTLTMVAGIGPKLSRRLKDAGCGDLEALAVAEVDDLVVVKGVFAERVSRWVAAATDLIKTKSAYFYKEEGPRVTAVVEGWPEGCEPYQLKQTLELEVKAHGKSVFQVTGKLEPHLVRVYTDRTTCDCADAARGRICKHVLATRLFAGNSELRRLARRLEEENSGSGVDLFSLWFHGEPGDRRDRATGVR